MKVAPLLLVILGLHLVGCNPAFDSPVVASSTSKVNITSFNQIKTGMTYQQVVEIFGSEGAKKNEYKIGDNVYSSYEWHPPGATYYPYISVDLKNGIVERTYNAGLK